MTIKDKKNNLKSGYVTLLSVLIVGAVGITITVSLLQIGIRSSQNSFISEQSGQSNGLANACVEEALQKIREVTTYTGSENIVLGQGDCTYTVTNTGGEGRRIIASSTVDVVVRKVEVTLDAINPFLNITSWQEVSEF